MKLQKQLSRKSGDIVYPKYVVVIPPEKIKEVGWREGTELDADVGQNKIILRPKKTAV
jgi:antitoxin component of MazEF toxin-antitoxin module